jgi:hypothetical protein
MEAFLVSSTNAFIQQMVWSKRPRLELDNDPTACNPGLCLQQKEKRRRARRKENEELVTKAAKQSCSGLPVWLSILQTVFLLGGMGGVH